MLGWEIAAAPQIITPEEAVALDDEMRAFVAPYRAIGDAAMKLRRLLEGMQDRGLFAMSYSDSFTRSASRTSTSVKATVCRSPCCSSLSRGRRASTRATKR